MLLQSIPSSGTGELIADRSRPDQGPPIGFCALSGSNLFRCPPLPGPALRPSMGEGVRIGSCTCEASSARMGRMPGVLVASASLYSFSVRAIVMRDCHRTPAPS